MYKLKFKKNHQNIKCSAGRTFSETVQFQRCFTYEFDRVPPSLNVCSDFFVTIKEKIYTLQRSEADVVLDLKKNKYI